VVIQTADHPRNTISTNALFYHSAFGFTKGYALPRVGVVIGNDVFIGHNAMILYPTKNIGDGAVIAAGSVVVEDVPPYAIVGGYPAKVLRYRFSKNTIEQLLKSRWWECSLEELEPVKEQFARPLEGGKIR
jgi:acetyltransferase-like isoleucine patch superfamily enzyme